MEVCRGNIDSSAESLKIRPYFSNQASLCNGQFRNRSQTVGQSYYQERLFKMSSLKLFKGDQLHNQSDMPSSYNTQVFQNETSSIDSLENLTGTLYSINKEYISEDSLNIDKKEYTDKFSISYRKKSISDGLLHETRYFQHLLHNKDFAFMNEIFLYKIKKKYNIAYGQLKSNYNHSLISLLEFYCPEKNESEDDKLSEDSLLCDSQPLHLMNMNSDISELCFKKNKPFSPQASSYEKGITENTTEKLNSSPISKMKEPDSQMLESNQCYHYATGDRNYNFNGQDLKKSSNTNIFAYKSMYFMESGKEDSISIDSLYDSLN